MNPVDERIRAAIEALAGQIPVTAPRLDEELPPGLRHRHLRTAALSVAAVAAGLLLFLSNSGGEQSVRTVDEGGGNCRGDEAGDIFLVAGPSNTNAALFRGTLCPLSFRALPDVTRVEGVSGAGGVIVVTRQGGEIQIGTDGAPPMPMSPFALAGPPRQSPDDTFIADATVSNEGTIAYTTNRPTTGDAVTDRLHAFDPKTGDVRPILADSRFLSHPAWGPGGRVAAFRQAQRPAEVPEISVVDANGNARHFALSPPPLMGNVLNVEWGASNVVAVSYDILDPDPVPVTILLNPDTGQQRIIRGYHALAWSPDGARLLAQGERDLFLLHGPDFTSPRRLGRPPSGALEAAWIECTPERCAPASGRVADKSVQATNQLGFAEFRSLGQAGRLVSGYYSPEQSEVNGKFLHDDGRELRYRVRVPASISRQTLIEELLEYGVPVTVEE